MPPKIRVSQKKQKNGGASKKKTAQSIARSTKKSNTKSAKSIAINPPKPAKSVKSAAQAAAYTALEEKVSKTFGVPISQISSTASKPTVIQKIQRDVHQAALSAQARESPFKDDLAERIPRAEVEEHIKLISAAAPTAMAAGSYRRGAHSSNDIDVVIREPIEDVIARLESAGYIRHTFSAGKHKFSGIVRLPNPGSRYRHLDIVMTNERAYPFAMLYFTGSARFNIIMRLKAKRRGLKLNEYGLFNGPDLVPGITTERDIFAALETPYKEPNER